MNYLGIDYGEKRIGVAVGSDDSSMAFPLTVLLNTEHVLRDIKSICEERSIDSIVVGESVNFKGEDNDIMEDIRLFVEALKESIKLPVELEPEYLTSVQANRFMSDENTDARAAALILQSFLDRKKT